MKKVYSGKTIICISLFGIVLLSIAIIVSAVSLILSISAGEMNIVIVDVVLIVGYFIFLLLFIFTLNRFGYKIMYESSSNTIYRKGFICGYRYKLKVDDINDIILVTFPKETTYFVLIDSYNTKYDGGTKGSFIRIEKTEKNYEFINQFWNKPIKEYKEYAELFK